MIRTDINTTIDTDLPSGAGLSAATLRGALKSMLDYTDDRGLATVGEATGLDIFNDTRYNRWFSVATADDGTVYLAQPSGTKHVSDGILKMTRTTNGTDWATPWTVQLAGVDMTKIAVVELGIAGDRMMIAYNVMNTAGTSPDETAVHFAYCDRDAANPDNWGHNFTGHSSLSSPGGNVFITSMNGMIVSEGLTRCCAYAYVVSGEDIVSSDAFFYQTTDRGVTWTKGPTIQARQKTNSGAANYYASFAFVNECAATPIYDSEGNPTDTWVAAIRVESSGGYHEQLYSTDGGATWTTLGYALDILHMTAVYAFPPHFYQVGDDLYYIMGFRGQWGPGDLTDAYRTIYYKAKATEVYNDKSKWGGPYVLNTYLATYKGAENDCGYARAYRAGGRHYVAFFDLTISHRPGTDATTPKARIAAIPLLGNGIYEAVNKTNQSAANGAEVIFNTPILDSEGMHRWGTIGFNANSLNQRVLSADGWYMASVRLQLTPEATKTYCRVIAQLIDTGAESGTAPEEKIREEYTHIIGPSAVEDFNLLQFTWQFYAWKGMEVRVYIEHDASAALTIVNTARDRRATLRIKRL